MSWLADRTVRSHRSTAEIQPDLEPQFAKTMGAKTITVASTHVPMLSHALETLRDEGRD